MTRISTFGHSQLMLSQLLKNQGEFRMAQLQVNTGKKAIDFQGLPREATTLLGAKATQTRINQYMSTATEVESRLDIYNLHLETMGSNMQDLKTVVMDALGTNEAVTLEGSLEAALATIINSLNSTVGGNYIFAGTRTDTPPINISSLADLTAAATAADVFDNNQLKPTARLDEGFVMEYGILAEDAALDAMTAIKALADFHFGGGGPINGQLTPAQETFLLAQVSVLDGAMQTILESNVINGTKNRQIGEVLDRHRDADNVLTGFISDIEDVDMAEAISRLNSDQLAIEASYQVLANLNRLSLLDFI